MLKNKYEARHHPTKRLTPERQGPGVMLYCLTCKALRLWLWITRFRAAKVAYSFPIYQISNKKYKVRVLYCIC